MSLTVINAFALAAAAPTTGKAYRYVGVHIVQSTNGYIGATQLSMFEAGSSTDRCLTATMGFTGSGNGSYPPSNLNDGNTGTLFTTNANQALPGGTSIVYADFGSGNAYKIEKIGWRSRSTFLENPAVWRAVGRNSTSDPWEHIAFLTQDYAWSDAEYKEFTFTPLADGATMSGYRYIRFSITAAQSGSYTSLDEMKHVMQSGAGSKSAWFWNGISATSSLGGYLATSIIDNTTSFWVSNGTTTCSVTIDYGTTLKCAASSFDVRPRSGYTTSEAPKNFTIEGSNDGSSWTTILSRTNFNSWVDGSFYTFT